MGLGWANKVSRLACTGIERDGALQPHRLRMSSLLVGLVLLVAGCDGSQGSTTTTTSAEEVSDASTTTTSAHPQVDLGSVTIPAGEPVRIHILQALTGEETLFGVEQIRGVELAVSDFGDLRGHPVELADVIDKPCDPKDAQAGAREIANLPGVLGVVVNTCSEAAVSALSILSDNGLVMISGFNTASTLTSDLIGNLGLNWYPGFYRFANNELYQARAAARFALETKLISKAVIISSSDDESQQLASAFARLFEQQGGEIVDQIEVTEGMRISTDVLIELGRLEPPFLYVAIPPSDVQGLFDQIRRTPGLEESIVFGREMLKGLTDTLNPELVGQAFFPGPDEVTISGSNEVTGIGFETLMAAYEQVYNAEPTSLHFTATYDATIFLLRAIEEVARIQPDGSVVVERAELRQYLDGLEKFNGITGDLHCLPPGDCGNAMVGIYEIGPDLVLFQVESVDGNRGTED